MRRRKPIKRKSQRQRIIEEIRNLTREILKIERGNISSISGRSDVPLGLFHILPVGLYPRLQFHKENLLLCEWFPYHHWWHHYSEKDKVNAHTVRRIEETVGANYRERLEILNAGSQALTDAYLGMLRDVRKQELKELGGKL